MAEARLDPPSPRRARGRPKAWDDKTAQNTIKSLDRAMGVLHRLSEMGGVTLTTLSADLGQPAASVYRVLVTLEARGLVEFEEAEQLWHVGAGAFLIGAAFLRRTSLVDRARPILRRLMEETGETANLGVPQEGTVLFVSQVETHASIRAFFPPGTMSPMHASGIGKALLAQMDAARLDRVLADRPLERFTPQTITDRTTLDRDLAHIRARGYAIDGEERTEGMRCVAAAVFDPHGEAMAGVSVSGPTTRIVPGALRPLGQAVALAAARLTSALGGRVTG